jgi:ABC-2 type transport system permease protein
MLVVRREAGVLKRLRSTPLPPPTYLAAVVLSTLTTFALQSVALLALGGIGLGASMPANWLGFAGAIVLGVACFAGLGLAAASLIRSAEGVSAVVNVVVLPMAFLLLPYRRLSVGTPGDADVPPLTCFLDIVNGVY